MSKGGGVEYANQNVLLQAELSAETEKETGIVVYQPHGEPRMGLVDGRIYPMFLPANIRGAKKLIVRDDDLFVCSYPKCGTTWLQFICLQLTRPRDEQQDPLYSVSPMIEEFGAENVEELASPRLLKCHLRHNEMPNTDKGKFIFICRNPKDMLVSQFHHHRLFKFYQWPEGTFDVQFKIFLEDRMPYGNYFTHVLSWWERRHDANVLILRYEDLLRDLPSAVQQVAHFIGGAAAQLVQDEQELARIVQESSFANMSQNQERWMPLKLIRQPTFVRSGSSKGWRRYFSKGQSDAMDTLIARGFAGTELAQWWQEELRWQEPKFASAA